VREQKTGNGDAFKNVNIKFLEGDALNSFRSYNKDHGRYRV